MGAASASSLTFEVGGQRLALPAIDVREVVRRGRLTPVPQAPPSLLGLANVRGLALPVLSCAALLDLPPGPAGSVIVLDGAVPVGLAVDQVREVVAGDVLEASADPPMPLDVLPLINRQFANLSVRPARRGERVAAQRARDAVQSRTLILGFIVGGQSFALALATIEAVIPVPTDIAAVPQADLATLGSVSWRGGLLPLFSLAVLLGLPDGVGDRRRIVIVRIEGHPVGFVVDAIGAVQTIDEGAIDPLPPVLARGGGEARIAAVIRKGDGTLTSLLAPDQFLNADLTARLGATLVEAGDMAHKITGTTETILLVTIAGQRYGLPLAAVDEIARRPAILTRLPRSPAFVRGVMHARTRALLVVDQAARFGAETLGQRLVIARSGALEAAFLVDQVLGVVGIPAQALSAAPAVGDDPQLFEAVVVEGVDAPMTLLLSPFALLDGTERAILASLADHEVARAL